jgi:hypothetical protein
VSRTASSAAAVRLVSFSAWNLSMRRPKPARSQLLRKGKNG